MQLAKKHSNFDNEMEQYRGTDWFDVALCSLVAVALVVLAIELSAPDHIIEQMASFITSIRTK